MSPLPDDDTTKYCVSFDIAKSIAQNITQEIAQEFTKREPGVLPKHVQDLIHTIENEENAATIERMVVVRTPVEEYVGHLMQVLSIGKYRETIKESYYDKVSTRYSAFASIFLLHMFLLLRCDMVRDIYLFPFFYIN